MPIHVRQGGVWREIPSNQNLVRQGGVWREVTNGYARAAGAWRLVYRLTYPWEGPGTGIFTWTELDTAVEVQYSWSSGPIYWYGSQLTNTNVFANGTTFRFRAAPHGGGTSCTRNRIGGSGLDPTSTCVTAFNTWSTWITVTNHNINISAHFYDP